MRDPSRQHAQALQLLGPLKPLVEPFSLGYVTPEDCQTILCRISIHFKPDIEGRIMRFEMHRHSVFHSPAKLGGNGGICTVRKKVPHVLAQDFLARNPAQLDGLVVDVCTSPFPIKGSETLAYAFEDIF